MAELEPLGPPGVYVAPDGALHLNVAEMCAAAGYDPTPENIAVLVNAARGLPSVSVVELVRCPGCELELELEDLAGQSAHMLEQHPDIVAARRADAARYDGWEVD